MIHLAVQDMPEKQDFKYIVRIADTDLPGEKNVVQALTTIKGISFHLSNVIADCAGVDRYKKIGELPEEEIEKIKEVISNLDRRVPYWLLNRRKDFYTGKNLHLIGTDIDVVRREDINILRKIRAYRGIRHELGLPVRGQRTRSNGRKGLALGVSRKKK